MIEWLTKKDGRGGKDASSKKEIGITVNGRKRYSANIIFRNDAHKKATNNEYVAIGFDSETNRLYFTSAEKNEGYKISKNKNHLNSRITVKDIDGWKKIEGDYDLKKDVTNNMYYIDIAACPAI